MIEHCLCAKCHKWLSPGGYVIVNKKYYCRGCAP